MQGAFAGPPNADEKYPAKAIEESTGKSKIEKGEAWSGDN